MRYNGSIVIPTQPGGARAMKKGKKETEIKKEEDSSLFPFTIERESGLSY
jgi:hypothetical protein